MLSWARETTWNSVCWMSYLPKIELNLFWIQNDYLIEVNILKPVFAIAMSSDKNDVLSHWLITVDPNTLLRFIMPIWKWCSLNFILLEKIVDRMNWMENQWTPSQLWEAVILMAITSQWLPDPVGLNQVHTVWSCVCYIMNCIYPLMLLFSSVKVCCVLLPSGPHYPITSLPIQISNFPPPNQAQCLPYASYCHVLCRHGNHCHKATISYHSLTAMQL